MQHDIRSYAALMLRKLRWRPPLSPVNLDRPIEGATEDAEILLAFAAQSRRTLKRELIDGLSMAREKVNAAIAADRTITSLERAEFWFAYDELAVAMAPLSAHSIRCSMQVNAKRFPASLVTTTAILAFVAIAVFLLCIGVQNFWVAGRDLLDRADAIETLRVDLNKQASDNSTALKRARQRSERLCTKIRESGGECGESEDGEARKVKALNHSQKIEIGKLSAQRELVIEDIDERQIVSEAKSAELEGLNTRGGSLQALLQQWHHRAMLICGTDSEDESKTRNWFARVLCPVDKGDAEERLKELQRTLKTEKRKLDDLDAPLQPVNASQNFNPADMQPARFNAISTDTRRRAEIFRQKFLLAELRREIAREEASVQRKTAHEVRIILGNLSSYIVPLIMGLLGALAYILQLLTTQLRDHTYVPTSVSGNIVRLCLGAIAGVFGALLAPGSDALLKGLPPLFVPFVFGYGIEILFALLNRIVKSFTQGEAGPARPA